MQPFQDVTLIYAGVSERFKEAVLKTVGVSKRPGVRIPPPALNSLRIGYTGFESLSYLVAPATKTYSFYIH